MSTIPRRSASSADSSVRGGCGKGAGGVTERCGIPRLDRGVDMEITQLLGIDVATPDDRPYRGGVLARPGGDTRDDFALSRLAVEATFSGDHSACTAKHFIELHEVEHVIDPGNQVGGPQRARETSGSSGARH